LSHHSSPVELRERFAFAESRIPEALQILRRSGNIEEAVILSTCNRVEIYAVAADSDATRGFSTVRDFLTEFHKHEGPLGSEFYTLTEPDSLRHLFRVAAGLDSMVMGETEILGQLKQAYQLAWKMVTRAGGSTVRSSEPSKPRSKFAPRQKSSAVV